MKSGIVITGIGVVSSEVNSKDELKNSQFDGMKKTKKFDPSEEFGKRGHKYWIPSTKYLLASIKRLLKDNLYKADYEPQQVGIIIGTNFSNREFIEDNFIKLQTKGLSSIEPIFAPNLSVNLSSSIASIKYKFTGNNITLTNNLLAGMQSIEVGMQQINNNRLKMVICGATEGTIPSSIKSYVENPSLEGSSCVVSLENYQDACQRKSPIYGFIHGLTNSFFPFNEGSPKYLSHLEALLKRDLEKVVQNKTKEINLYLTHHLGSFSKHINNTIRGILQESGIRFYEIDCIGKNYEKITVSPVLLVAQSVMNNSEISQNLIVCNNSEGNINMISITKINN